MSNWPVPHVYIDVFGSLRDVYVIIKQHEHNDLAVILYFHHAEITDSPLRRSLVDVESTRVVCGVLIRMCFLLPSGLSFSVRFSPVVRKTHLTDTFLSKPPTLLEAHGISKAYSFHLSSFTIDIIFFSSRTMSADLPARLVSHFRLTRIICHAKALLSLWNVSDKTPIQIFPVRLNSSLGWCRVTGIQHPPRHHLRQDPILQEMSRVWLCGGDDE